MSPDSVLQLRRARPFVPFRLHLTDGQSFDVRYPDMILVGYRSLTVGIPRRKDDRTYRAVMGVSFANLERIELISQDEANPRS
jgi:hypothetical protein